MSTKIQISAKLENGEEYNFDANSNITIRQVKSILKALTGLKQEIRVFNEFADFTESEDNINVLFPGEKRVELFIGGEIEEHDDDKTQIFINTGKFCDKHHSKFPYFYCFDCKCSVCPDCIISNEHKNHKIEDKHDFLQNSINVLTGFFNDGSEVLKIETTKNNKNLDFESLKKEITFKHIPVIEDSFRIIKEKIIESLDVYKNDYDTSFDHMKQNIYLLKNHCLSGLDQIKHQLNFQDAMLDEEIFLTFSDKIKRLENDSMRISKDETNIKEFHNNYQNIVNMIEVFFQDIRKFLGNMQKANIFETIKAEGTDSIVKLVSENEITRLDFSDTHPKRKLSKKSSKQQTPNKEQHLEEKKETTKSITKSITSTNGNGNNTGNHINDSHFTTMIFKSIPNNNQIVIYNDNSKIVEAKQQHIPKLVLPTQKFLPNSANLNYNGSLYISGGEHNNKEASDTFLIYNIHSGYLLRLSDMMNARHSHSMFYYNDYIYSIGGYRNNTTERYCLRTHKKWEQLDNLNSEERQSPILYAEGNYLYAFFGYAAGKYLDSVERLNLNTISTKKGSKWEIVPTIKKVTDLGMIGAGIVRSTSSKDEILFFGGRNGKEDKRTTISFNFKTNTFSPVIDLLLEDPTYFNESQLINFSKGTWGHFNMSNNSILKIELNN